MAQVSDLFSRSDENPLASPWASVTGQSALQLVSNTARPSAISVGCVQRHTGVNAGNQQFAKVKLGTLSGSGTIIIILCICYNTGGADTGYRAQYGGSGSWTVYRVTAGATTSLDTFSHTPASSDIYVFWLDGGNLKFSINGGAPAVTVADANYTSGNPGLGLYSNNATNDVVVSEFYGGDGTDWTGGGASAVPLLMQMYHGG